MTIGYILQLMEKTSKMSSVSINQLCSAVYLNKEDCIKEAKNRTKKCKTKLIFNEADWDDYPINTRFFYVKEIKVI